MDLKDGVQHTLFTKRDISRLLWPLVVEQILEVTVGMADVLMVSSVGEAAVSGVSLVDMINVLILNIFAAMATGGAVVVSQWLGAQEREKACHTAAQLLTAAFLLAICIMILVLIFRSSLLHLFFGPVEPDVMDACLVYFSISAWSYPFIALYNAGAALYRSMGNSRISMYTSIFMNIVNVSGNAICVYGLHMGVAGVAMPSLVSRFLAAILMLLLIGSRENSVYVRYRWSELRPKALYMKRILHIALPSAMENSMFQLGRILVVSIITNFGTTQIAANGVANNLDNFGCIPGMAINLGIITVVGRCVGAGDLKQTRYYAKKLMRVCLLCTAALNGIMMLMLPLILGLYSLSAETMQLTATLVYIHSGFLIPLYVPAFSIPNVLRAANDVKFPMCISIFSMWIFRIIFSYILGIYFGMGAIGVWCAMVADWAFRAICFSVRYFRGRWTKYAKYRI